MSFETVERLKREYTDKWVTVDPHTPELRRFVGLSGQIKTVNMNGRALVQFDNPIDISWYDIDMSFLRVVNGPLPKKVVEKPAEPAKKPAAEAKPAAAAAGKSPLELARAQGAAKAAGAGASAAGGTAASGDKPMSKLEMARMQALGKVVSAPAGAADAANVSPDPVAPPATAADDRAAAPNPVTPSAAPPDILGADGKPLSKLELARRQGAAKRSE